MRVQRVRASLFLVLGMGMATACAPELDTTRITQARRTIGEEIYNELCNRIAREAIPLDVEGFQTKETCQQGSEPTVESLRLRSGLAARWWPGLGVPDRLAVRVTLHRGEARLHSFETFVESRLGGEDWGDPRERARRLARRLGQRVAGLL